MTKLPFQNFDGTTKNFRVTKLFGFFGLERREIEEAKAGDLIAISGMEDIFVGETITPTDAVEPLPVLRIDEPTLQMTFLANNSPFAGREGKHVTSRKVEERLLAELQTDVSLRVDPTDSPDKWTVSVVVNCTCLSLSKQCVVKDTNFKCLVQKLSSKKLMA